MDNRGPLESFIFSLFGYIIILFVTTSIITGTVLLLVKTALNAREGDWGAAIVLGVLLTICAMWLYFDGGDNE